MREEVSPIERSRSARLSPAPEYRELERAGAFDRLARLAGRLLNAPIALVAMYDGDYVRFCGMFGVPEPLATEREEPLEGSFCQVVLTSDGPLAINDIGAHPVFCTHPARVQFGASAYLGVPLRDSGQQLFGALCVIDRTPRDWMDADLAGLDDLALSVVAELQLHQDITARRSAEEALVESELRYRLMADHIDAVLWMLNPHTDEIVYTSSAFERIWGQPVEVLRQPGQFLTMIHPEDQQRMLEGLARQRSESTVFEYRIVRPDGQVVWIRDQNFLIHAPDGSIAQVVGIATDITAEWNAHQALRASEAQYRLLFESNPQPMWVLDLETVGFLAVNEAAVAHYGYSRAEFLELTALDIHVSEEAQVTREFYRRALLGYYRSDQTWRHRRKDGATIKVEIALSRIRFDSREACLVMVTDVTEWRDLQAQMIQAQKLESLGRLAGSVAHDFNNVLTAISGSAYFIAESLPPGDPRHADVEEVVHAVEHATTLTRQLLAFARRQIVEPQILNLNDLIGELSRLLRRLIGETIQLETRLDPRIGPVRIDPGQFEQVLMNLAVNARDAMPGGGVLTIGTSILQVNIDAPALAGVLTRGPYALVTVSDTGTGMTPDLQAHIFEPFFTTKELGKGTGLGLAVCHGIIKQAGGDIWISSTLGQGTTVTIALPYADDTVGPSRDARMRLPQGGTETVLLAEDDGLVRETTAQALRAYGYTVLVAEDGPSALALAITYDGTIDLLVTDLGMPYMGGKVLATKLAARRPGVAVLYITGYADVEDIPTDIAEGSLLQKPFTPATLARSVRAQLDRRTQRRGDQVIG